ncbi:LytR family transcriptional regulator [Patescibacteria group bacterium]|nr:LytR family transcriptional regulator [Patescibacteria group bacterium]
MSSGWFTYKIASASDKIFTANVTGGSLLLKGKKLKDADGRINILLIGIGGAGHDGPNLADTIQLVSISPKDKSVAMVSIPRDLYVQVPDSYQKVKINEVHSIGEDNGTEGGGPALLEQKVSDITGQKVQYFIRADFDGFKQVIDSMNGVDINVPEPGLYDPYYPLGYSYQIVNVKPGQQHMAGELALEYARSRETTSDFDRSKRQQQVLVAARDKALSVQYLTNPAKISHLIDILGDHVKTDLSLGEAQRLAEIVRDIPSDKVTSKVVDGMDSGLLYDSVGPGGAYILLPRSGDYSEIQQFVAQLLSDSGVRQEQPKVEIQNASGQSGLAKSESDLLTGDGFSVTSVTNAPSTAQQTVVYDYSNGQKSKSVEFLAKRYNAQVIKQPGQRTDVDMAIVIGSDYIKNSGNQTAQ